MKALTLFVALAFVQSAHAQALPERPPKKLRCTVCAHDPKLMEQNNFHHGIFPLFTTDNLTVQGQLDLSGIVWMETEHFRIGLDLDDWKIPPKDKKEYRAEFALLALQYPSIRPKKISKIDKWLRIHLYGMRLENLYQRFLETVQYTNEEFDILPDEELFLIAAKSSDFFSPLREHFVETVSKNGSWPDRLPQNVGIGRFLGEPNKYEVLMLQYRGDFNRLKSDFLGMKDDHPQRWHTRFESADGVNPSRCLGFGITATAEDLIKHDQHMHNAILHNVGILLLNGFMLYRISLPEWLLSGWGHLLSRENRPEYNFYDLDEGVSGIDRDAVNWAPLVRKLVVKDDAATFLDLAQAANFADLAFNEHIVAWSKVQFLSTIHRDNFASYILAIKNDAAQSGNLGVQRRAMKSAFGWNLLSAEARWKAWVLETYPVK